MHTATRTLLATLAALLLAACGGGDEAPGDEAPATTQPVDCKARPDLCQ